MNAHRIVESALRRVERRAEAAERAGSSVAARDLWHAWEILHTLGMVLDMESVVADYRERLADACAPRAGEDE